jgi:hypothetical protein
MEVAYIYPSSVRGSQDSGLLSSSFKGRVKIPINPRRRSKIGKSYCSCFRISRASGLTLTHWFKETYHGKLERWQNDFANAIRTDDLFTDANLSEGAPRDGYYSIDRKPNCCSDSNATIIADVCVPHLTAADFPMMGSSARFWTSCCV